MHPPITLPNIRIITVSGRIGAGSTTLAKGLSRTLSWKHLEGGEIFWEKARKELGLLAKDTNLRPDEQDKLFDAELKRILCDDSHIVLETKLAGFNAQGIEGIFKILVICENEKGEDQTQIRIDRLINREKLSAEEAKEEVMHREKADLEKWRALYAEGNPNWVYFDRKYYNLVINTYSLNNEQALELSLSAVGYK